METEVQYFFLCTVAEFFPAARLHYNFYIFILAAASPPFTLFLIRSRPAPQSHLFLVLYTWQGPEVLTEWNSEWLIPQLILAIPEIL